MQMHIKKLLGVKTLTYLSFLYSVAITILLLIPIPEDTSVSIPFFDKIAHITVYAVLGLLWFLVILKREQTSTVWIALLLLSFYGIVIEVVQGMLIVSRNFDALDILANTLGLLLGMGTYFIIKQRRWL